MHRNNVDVNKVQPTTGPPRRVLHYQKHDLTIPKQRKKNQEIEKMR